MQGRLQEGACSRREKTERRQARAWVPLDLLNRLSQEQMSGEYTSGRLSSWLGVGLDAPSSRDVQLSEIWEDYGLES